MASIRPDGILRATLLACVFITLVTLTACSKPSRDLQAGSYRATLELPGQKLVPFGLDVAREEAGWVFYLLNGPERVRVPEVQATPGRVTARMPGYEHTLTATIEGGRLSGVLEMVRPDGRRSKLPFAAELGATWRFDPEPLSDNADFSGLWDVTLTDVQGHQTRGIADFAQRHDQVAGTVLLPTHDQRYLAGEARDETLRLSRFDGGAVLLYEGKLDAKGQWIGQTWSDTDGAGRFFAHRNPDATLASAVVGTPVSAAGETLRFALRDADGRIVASDGADLGRRVLLLGIGSRGSPVTHDLARELAALDVRYRDRGLAVVALMLEPDSAFDRSATAVRRFRAANGVTYPTLIVAPGERDALPREVVRGPATAVIVDRDGKIRRIESRIFSPAAGDRQVQQALDLATAVEALLAEGPGEASMPTGAGAAEPVSPGSS